MLSLTSVSSLFTWKVKLIAIAVILSSLTFGYFYWQNHQRNIGENRATVKYNEMIENQKKEAAVKLLDEINKTRTIEKELQKKIQEREIKDAKSQKTIYNLSYQLKLLSSNGLRDPNARPRDCSGSTSGTNTSTTSNSTDNGAQTSGLLSTELTGLLQKLTLEADEINNAYISCKEYSNEIEILR